MFPQSSDYFELSDEKIIEKTEQQFSLLKQDFIKYNQLTAYYTERVNSILSSSNETDLKELIQIIKSKDFIWCCYYSQNFSILASMEIIIPLEEKNGFPASVQAMNSIEEVAECYTKIAFFFRRMEFDFPLEEYIEIVSVINQYHLSPFYLYITLTKGLFDQKKKIGQQLANLYQCMGQEKWAALFRSIS